MRLVARQVSRHARYGIVLLVGALLTACVDRGAISVFATTGSDVCTTLAKAYRLIKDQASDYEALRNVYIALNGLTTPQLWKPEVLQEQLDNRIEMAQTLGRIYGVLGALSSDKTTQDLVSAGQNFGQALTDATPLFGVTAPLTLALKGAKELGGRLAKWKADQDLGQALKDISTAPGTVLSVFDDDTNSLVVIADNYAQMLDELANTVVIKGVVRKEDIIRMLSDMYGLTLADNPCDKLSCDTVGTALLKTRSARIFQLTKATINASARALAALASVETGQPVQAQAGRVQLAEQAVKEAQGYLTQLNALRTPPQTGH